MSIRRLLLVPILVVATACGAGSSTGPSGGSEDGPAPLDAALITEGKPLYDAYCALCHGIDGAGADNWKVVNADGSYPPPPHDSTGHTWHHSDRLLIDLSGFLNVAFDSRDVLTMWLVGLPPLRRHLEMQQHAPLAMRVAAQVHLEPFIERRPMSSIQSTFEDLRVHGLSRRVVLIPD